MNEKQRAKTVLRIFKKTLAPPKWMKSERNPFETLVITILSQNTSDINTSKAFEALSTRFEIVPEVLAKAEIIQIQSAIRTAGLYRAKSKAIKLAASCIVEKYDCSMQAILSMPLEQARNALMQIPGVGPKTADVVLLIAAAFPTIPVDTHVNRVAKRLELVPENGNYQVVRGSLQALFDPPDYLLVHLLFIAHGRKTCKALLPLCKQCPVCSCCPSCGKWGKP